MQSFPRATAEDAAHCERRARRKRRRKRRRRRKASLVQGGPVAGGGDPLPPQGVLWERLSAHPPRLPPGRPGLS